MMLFRLLFALSLLATSIANSCSNPGGQNVTRDDGTTYPYFGMPCSGSGTTRIYVASLRLLTQWGIAVLCILLFAYCMRNVICSYIFTPSYCASFFVFYFLYQFLFTVSLCAMFSSSYCAQ